MNFYKHHIGDYDQATRHLSFVEDAAYSRLIRKYYAEEKPLPEDVKKVQRLIGARSRDEKEAVETVLAEFFVLETDGWHNKRCDEEIAQANAQAETNRRIAREREEKKRQRKANETSTNRGQEDSTNRDEEKHDSWSGEKHDSFGSREPSQTPDTRHQTPDLKPSSPSGALGTSAQGQSDTLSAVDVSMRIIGWERERGKIARGVSASNAQVIDLAAQKPTADELRKAYDMAVADRQATGDANPVNAGFVLALLAKVRNPPKPREPKPLPLHALSDVQLNAEGRRVGAGEARMGESRPEYIARIQTAMAEAQGRATA